MNAAERHPQIYEDPQKYVIFKSFLKNKFKNSISEN